MKKLITVLFSTFFLIIAFSSWQLISFTLTPTQNVHKEILFEITPGSSFHSVAKDLFLKRLISDERWFNIYAQIIQKTKYIKVGEFELATDMKPKDILNILVSGHSKTYNLTVPEGHNIYEIRDELNKMWATRGDEFFKLATNQKFVKEISGREVDSLEGYLFPETYTLTKYTKMESLIRKMYEFYRESILLANQNALVHLDMHDQVTLASVIEKETGAPEERAIISSVFHNRLKIGMRLQSDPTIIYGILVETNILKKNISKTDILHPTPYNTYTIKGLPKGPISNPGKDSLWAVTHPAHTNFLYFVSRNDGTHVFTENYKSHAAAVKSFQLNQKSRVGKSWRDLKKIKK